MKTSSHTISLNYTLPSPRNAVQIDMKTINKVSLHIFMNFTQKYKVKLHQFSSVTVYNRAKSYIRRALTVVAQGPQMICFGTVGTMMNVFFSSDHVRGSSFIGSYYNLLVQFSNTFFFKLGLQQWDSQIKNLYGNFAVLLR